jgi:hypothetical protein
MQSWMKYLNWTVTVMIGFVWFVNGLMCKVLGIVPRHEAIVARILGVDYAHHLTIMIGLSEMVMAVWVWSGKWKRLNIWTQISLVATMNILESIIAHDLLLWSKWNLVWAGVFISIVYFNHRISKQT